MDNQMINGLVSFLDNSPSCFHAIENVKGILAGYTELKENADWKLVPGGKYYTVRKDSSLIAFRVPPDKIDSVYITASHSDSPSFKIKTNSEMISEGHYTRLNTEKYGGMNMSSWLDRPLSVAGRIVVKQGASYVSKLVNVDKDLLLIPSVAIHMNRDLNDGVKYDAQIDTIPLMGNEKTAGSLIGAVAESAKVDSDEILGSDLFLYNRENAKLWGANNEYISSRALDDLQCVYGCVRGFADAKNSDNKLTVCAIFDNEEVGSLTAQGADSTFMSDVLMRIAEALGYSNSDLLKIISNGLMVSADNAHAVHPNHPEYADPTNRPYMNGGIVIKYNAAQRYTTDALSEAMFKDVCNTAGVPVQTYTNKSNVAGGSTLGNLANRHVSIKTVDIGLAQLSMHSSYETAGSEDIEYLVRAIKVFYE